jgi:integrase
MTEISGVEIARWRDERGRRCAPATVLRELQLISHVFVVARSEWGYPVTNPVAEIRRPRVRNQRDVRISPEVIVRIAAELNPEMGAIVRFAVETGMRRSEILGMRWSWVRDSIVWIPDTKSGVARGVPLSQTAQELLAGLVRLPGGKVWSCQGDSITHAFKRSAVRVGHGELRFHDLRHEAISRWFERGFHVMEVQLMSGHKTLPMLMRYTHLRPESLVGRI